MESLAFVHIAFAYEDSTPAPKLRGLGEGFEELNWVFSSPVWINLGVALVLSVLTTATEAILTTAPIAQAQTAGAGYQNTAVVRTRYGVGVYTRASPAGAVVGGRREGSRVSLTGAQANAGASQWSQLTDGTWVATAYLVSDSGYVPVPQGWTTNVGYGSTAIVRTRYGVGVNSRTNPGGRIIGGKLEGSRVVVTGAQADAAGYRWAQITDGTWSATPYLILENVVSPGPTPYPPPQSPPPQGFTQRIEFAPGASSARISGSAAQGVQNTYLLRAQGNQTLSVNLASTGNNAVFDVVAPNGAILVQQTAYWQGRLPTDGDYRIILRSQGGSTNYTFDVAIAGSDLPPPGGVTQRIEFAPGASSARVSSGVVRGTQNSYLLRARRNQTMSVSLTSTENNAVFDVVAPNGATLVQQTAYWQGRLPADGDYRIIVRSQRGNANYTFDVALSGNAAPPNGITQRIEFAPGASSARVSGSAAQRVRNTYLLRAQNNQTLSVNLTSRENNALFDVVAPNGRTLVQQTAYWQGRLPADGDYQIIVRSRQGSTNYTFDVSISGDSGDDTPPGGITQRIEFAPGASSAQVSGGVAPGNRNTYLLRTEGDQTMSVSLTSAGNNAVFSVLAPNGTTLVRQTPSWEGRLPADGDYRIIVRPRQGSANYTLNVAISRSDVTPPGGLTQRIEFAPGDLSKNVSGSVILGTRNTYLLNTQRGQVISVNLDPPESNAVIDILDPRGRTVTQGTNFWNGESSQDGDYRIVVSSTRGNASYSFLVSVGNLQ